MYSEIGMEEILIEIWKNEAGKRVCDVSDDHMVVVISAERSNYTHHRKYGWNTQN